MGIIINHNSGSLFFTTSKIESKEPGSSLGGPMVFCTQKNLPKSGTIVSRTRASNFVVIYGGRTWDPNDPTAKKVPRPTVYPGPYQRKTLKIGQNCPTP